MDAPIIVSDPAAITWSPSILDYPTEPRATEAIETLICAVEELLWRIPGVADSEIGRLRAQVTSALPAARDAIARNAEPKVQSDPFFTPYLDACTRDWAGLFLGAAMMFGLAVGLWSGRFAAPRHLRGSHIFLQRSS
jgi:hypothetical protein